MLVKVYKPESVCPGSGRAMRQNGWDTKCMEGTGPKVGCGQMQEGPACHAKETGALLLVMNNQRCLREKVQTEATFSLKSILFHLYKVFFKY